MSKSSTSGKTSSNQTQSANASATPNNLPQLQQAWGTAGNLAGQTAPQGAALAQTGLNLTGVGANAASGAATTGLNQALAFGTPGGTANGANQYLTPFADGSMSGNNPNFQNVLDQFSRGAQAATDGSFAADGRYGSGANANAFNSAVANEAGQLGYQNYTDSLNRQLTGAAQLSNNNTNSTAQSINALDLINGLGSTATGAGTTALAAGNTPALTYAQILQALGGGGGTQTSSGTASGTGTSNSSTSGFNLGGIIGGNGGIFPQFKW